MFARSAISAVARASPATQAAVRTFAGSQVSNSNNIEVFVNDEAVEIPRGASVMAACDAAGVDIPRFCYHHRLSVAGNCRMCLVEVEKAPKPVASCAMPAAPGMKIKTDTPLVKKAREGVMEFLLINHPLDCPICDQGGECDLQDMSKYFGSDRSRFMEMKRTVEDKNLGPLVKTVMTRCIHCTRCVRYAEEVAGVEDLGVTGRGNASEIGTYVEKLMTSEMSGNVIDLCPVGALTSKPFAFTARNWELKGTETIDVHDALGSAVRVDARGSEVMRVVARLNEDVNEEWISDKARFAYDGLKRQRLNMPYVRKDGKLESVYWEEALTAAAAAIKRVKPTQMMAVSGKIVEAESLVALKDLMNKLGCEQLSSEAGFETMDADVRSNYIMNSSISGIEDADFILLVGTNPRLEATVLNSRLRKAFLNGASIASIGPDADLTFPCQNYGDSTALLTELASGKGTAFTQLKAAKKPMLIVGSSVLRRPDRDIILSTVNSVVEKSGNVVCDGWNGFNVLHDSAGRVAAMDLGFLPATRAAVNTEQPKFVYLLASDEYDDSLIPADAFVIYQGHHGDKGAARADIVFPGAAHTEKSGTYVNTEGRAQQTQRCVPVPGQAREDWKIIRALSEVCTL
mmetsp:Transcript_25124/g.44793  ORF Transcript_25124/g.44793 Transcript_25124/m.44793 type:complete len:629 (-) Transcript_25124:652-2538(-)